MQGEVKGDGGVMSVIKKIEKLSDYKINTGLETYEGFRVETDSGFIEILVEDQLSCCEEWGSIISNDDLSFFVGAEIISKRFVNNDTYDDCEIIKEKVEWIEVLDCAFIDLETTKGKLQLAVYNNHNGYYGHNIKIIENGITYLLKE